MMNADFPFWKDFLQFCQKLINTPSLPGEEGPVAHLIQDKMKQLDYDDVHIDRVGNVIGLIKGNPKRPTLCFTAHMDHVDPGDPKGWEFPPYSGAISDGYLHGRGTSDLKGVVATHVYIAESLKQTNVDHGDIYIIEVVHEEYGGLGSDYLDDGIKHAIDYAINGEPTSNTIKIGHRGRIELLVHFGGKAAHAGTPELGVNPFYKMATFISKLEKLKMACDDYEVSTAEPTTCRTDPQSSNVIPGQCELTIDWRNIPGEFEGKVVEKVKSLLPEGCNVSVVERQLRTYTNLLFNIKRCKPPFSIDKAHPLVKETAQAVRSVLKREVEVSRWPFSTDCQFFMEAGIPIVGFSPGEEKYIHTNKERISLDLMREAMLCYPAIISSLSKLEKRKRSG